MYWLATAHSLRLKMKTSLTCLIKLSNRVSGWFFWPLRRFGKIPVWVLLGQLSPCAVFWKGHVFIPACALSLQRESQLPFGGISGNAENHPFKSHFR